MGRFTEHPAARFALMPLMAVLLLLTPIYDQRVPVLKDFHVTSVRHTPEGFELWGWMEKQRNCPIEEFHAVVYFSDGSPRRPIRIRTPAEPGPDERIAVQRLLSRQTGKSAFGPWFSPITDSTNVVAIHIYTGHDCWRYRLTEREMPIWRYGS